ncbi:MAG: hypothetical protein AMXMBFR81_19310 [Chthonomonas sp.]
MDIDNSYAAPETGDHAAFDDDCLLTDADLRRRLIERWPLLNEVWARRLFAYVFVGRFRDRESDMLMMGAAFLRDRLGVDGKRLKRFRREVFDLKLTQSRRPHPSNPSEQGRTRQLQRHECPREVVEELRRSWRGGGPFVSFATGCPPKPGGWDDALSDADNVVPEARFLVDHLHAVPNEALAWLERRADSRIADLDKAPESDALRDEPILCRVRACARVRYRGARRSPRLYAFGTSYLALTRESRKHLGQPFAACDLRQCQLVVASALWKADLFAEKLSKKNFSVWEWLAKAVGCGSGHKDALKQAVYSLVFGKAEGGLKKALSESIGTRAAKRFLALPEMRQLLDRREDALNRLRTVGGEVDAFGRGIGLCADAEEARSRLSYQIQSYELRIMLGLAERVIEEGFHVVGFLHDGMSIHGDDKAAADRLLRRLEKLSVEVGKEVLGVPIYLETNQWERRGRKPSRRAGAEPPASPADFEPFAPSPPDAGLVQGADVPDGEDAGGRLAVAA